VSTLLRASELSALPVVTFAGEAVGQVKDIVYAAHGGQVDAFTLAGRGLFAGPLNRAVPWASVVGIGPDAIIIESDERLVPVGDVLAPAATAAPGRGDVLKSQVLTDQGTALGVVSDVIIGILEAGRSQADVIGYEIEPAETLGRGRQRLLIPLPDTIAASGEHLIVPASASSYLTDNLAQFGSAVDAFRAQLASQAGSGANSAADARVGASGSAAGGAQPVGGADEPSNSPQGA
jgi:sporulation protein YlmC with PRC-barrel domain